MDHRESYARPRFAFKIIWLISILASGATTCIAEPAFAQKANISDLSDFSFGTAGTNADQSKTDNICVYSSTATKNYSVVATGSGSGGAFVIAASSATLKYDVQWAGSASQTSGTALTAGTTSGIFTSSATASGCTSGPTTSATLIVNLRLVDKLVAQAGSYTGSLSITITPQ